VIAACVAACHRNKKYWSNPDEFYPQHFLDEFGQLKKKVEGFIPFLIGKLIIASKTVMYSTSNRVNFSHIGQATMSWGEPR